MLYAFCCDFGNHWLHVKHAADAQYEKLTWRLDAICDWCFLHVALECSHCPSELTPQVRSVLKWHRFHGLVELEENRADAVKVVTEVKLLIDGAKVNNPKRYGMSLMWRLYNSMASMELLACTSCPAPFIQLVGQHSMPLRGMAPAWWCQLWSAWRP